jgi:hypothetical protein
MTDVVVTLKKIKKILHQIGISNNAGSCPMIHLQQKSNKLRAERMILIQARGCSFGRLGSSGTERLSYPTS